MPAKRELCIQHDPYIVRVAVSLETWSFTALSTVALTPHASYPVATTVPKSFQFDPAVPGLVWIDVHDLGCSAFVRRLLRSMKLLQRHSVLPSSSPRTHSPHHPPRTGRNEERRSTADTPDGREIYQLIFACAVGKRPEDFIFTRDDGEPIRDFRDAWWKACVAAGRGKFACKECH